MINTVYQSWADMSMAPEYTDCVTAIRYILLWVSDYVLPRAYIWDMPQMMIDAGASEVSLQFAQPWDIIFFERMSFTHGHYMIAHIGIIISESEFFHSSLHHNWWQISSYHTQEYESMILDESYLSIASDPRHHD